MSGPLYDRVALNTWLVGQLTTTDLPIGLGVAPDGCGWVNGGSPAEGNTPGSTFSAFATLTPGTGAAHFRNPLADSTSSYAQPYSLTSVGGVPEQTEDAASGLRTLVAAIGKTKLDLGGPWAVLKCDITTLGALVRNDTVNPPWWTVSDTVTLWLDRARAL
jgi:hypothetical protein